MNEGMVASHYIGFSPVRTAYVKKLDSFCARACRVADSPYELQIFTKTDKKFSVHWQNYAQKTDNEPVNITRVSISCMGYGSMEFEHPTDVSGHGFRLFRGKFPRFPGPITNEVCLYYRPEWNATHVCTEHCDVGDVLW